MALKHPTRASRQEDLEKRRQELLAVKNVIESEVFQKYFANKFYQADKKLKAAYDCKDFNEFLEIKGRHWGLSFLFKCVDEVENELKFIDNDLKKIA